MRHIEKYTPPSADDLNQLKESLGYTGNQMADLAGVASSSQWQKYTGGESPRAISPPVPFLITAQLTLDEDKLKSALRKMSDIS